MAFNGSGTFSLISGNPVVTGTTISSTWANNTLSDIAGNGLSLCLTKDGQQTPTANIPFGGFRLTGVGNAVNAQDVVTATQIQNGALTQLNSVAGTDTITATTSPAISAYAAGQAFIGIAAGANTTTSVTLNVNGLGAKSVKKFGSNALAVGDIQSAMDLYYDGTQFQLLNPLFALGGTLVGVQIFTSNGTYVPSAGASKALIKAVGGGGGGGGAATSSGVAYAGSGGGAGGYVEAFISSGLQTTYASVAVTIGAGGNAGGSGLSGTNGGNTTFGTYLTASGGAKGIGGNATFTNAAPSGNSGASSTSLTAIVLLPGQSSVIPVLNGASNGTSGGSNGCSGPLGAGGVGAYVQDLGGTWTVSAGSVGTGYGSGGGGGVALNTTGMSGYSGAGGILIAYEFA